MKFSDFFGWPLRYLDRYCIIFVFTGLITCFPGALLWVFTLGSFRYLHLMDKWGDYLIERSLRP